MSKLRVLYILYHFPQISETYIRSEIEALGEEYDLRVISLRRADYPYRDHVPFRETDDVRVIEEVIEEFRPDVLHTHWLHQTRILAYFAGYFSDRRGRPDIPFTVRSHSFDVLEHGGQFVRESVPLVNSDLC